MPEPEPGPASPADQHPLDRLVEVVAQLREHCPWMAELTHASLVEYLVEECYELVDALDDSTCDSAGGAAEVRGELGDVLLQVVLHAQLQQERGHFNLTDVVDGLTRKMIRRNPHVFTPDGALHTSNTATVEEIVATWQQVKRAEESRRADPFHGIPRQLPALALAAKTLRRTGSSLPQPGVLPAPGEHLPAPQTEAELGDLLLSVVQRSTIAGLDPELALRSAVLRLQERSLAGLPEDMIGTTTDVSTRLGLSPPRSPQPD
ncbi:MazG nucleotide pyrophosphohydrolase domain-containing protein [Arthrobacter sp. H20]|uniref:MazG nucleotide pyrophosphohydrolase domain-containing protein n=1 Tax=Arthrobacter sp. H20 TaxID=1267981 RepID=UPI00047C7C38|nr:MazG nucleotide pyrophosphohydrolase domain-containing protein [Arthrobacter sp. H20]